MELGWAPPSSDGGAAITGYRIQQGFAASNESAYSTVVSNTGSASTIYTVRGLNNGTAYNFRVAAINAAGVGAYSDNTQATPTNAGFLGCSSSLVTCASDSQDLGERGNSINQGFQEFAIPAGQILAIPFTTSESISAFNSGYVDRYSFQTFPAGYTFHTWWSDDAGDMPRAGAGCTAASANYQGRVYWRDSAGASDCGLGTGEHRRWFNVAICDSPFDCLPMNGHNYYQGSYYLSLDSRGT